MFLKEIEMQGFKSFADKTRIEFDRGVTAVVGPNGSGKSNITESLRWALGQDARCHFCRNPGPQSLKFCPGNGGFGQL